ncbi:FAD binding domain-containing protein [Sphaerisporangium sp. NPDC088356]|uniref:FAD binding domain-containing protein n=1 Tax=Sphaerisporangium sp. NPDC088356 TaxID=3154871 RepID=UPI00342AA2AC
MIPTSFDYAAPTTAEELTALVAADPAGTVVLSGGTWVVPALNRGQLTPRRVVDLSRAGLGSIERSGETIRVGAAVTYADLLASDLIADELPLLRLMAHEVTGGPQVHNQGTLGGSVCAARPGSDAPATVVTLDGVAVIGGGASTRRVPMAEFVTGAFTTCLAAGEVLLGFEFPGQRGARTGYHKVKRGGSSWPIATASVLLHLGPDGRCERARMTLGGVAATPVPVPVEQVLRGRAPLPAVLDEAAGLAARQVTDPWHDELASGAYRAAVTRAVAGRALRQALEHDHEEQNR